MGHDVTPGQLAAFVKGELTGAELKRAVKHVNACAECQKWLDAYVRHTATDDQPMAGQSLPVPPQGELPEFLRKLIAQGAPDPLPHGADTPGAPDLPPPREEGRVKPGTVLRGKRGQYLLVKLHGRGGMGCVWLAREINQGGQVQDTELALKTIREGLDAQERSQYIARFDREVETMERVRDIKNCACIIDSGYDPDQDVVFYVMKLVGGSNVQEALASLSELLAKLDRMKDIEVLKRVYEGWTHQKELVHGVGEVMKKRTGIHVLEWATIVEKIARVVHEMHEVGVGHRDIKPANIILDPNGEPCLVDLGLSKRFTQPGAGVDTRQSSGQTASSSPPDRVDANLTHAGVIGTPDYMAPERKKEPGLSSRSSDIYSLGVTLCEVLTGILPSQAEQNGRLDISALRQDRLTSAFAHVCQTCLDSDPARRYATAADLANAIRAAQRSISLPPLALAMYNILRTLVPNENAKITLKQLNSRLPHPYTGGKYNYPELVEACSELSRACHALDLPNIGALIVGELENPVKRGFIQERIPIMKDDLFQAFVAGLRIERELARRAEYPNFLPAAPPQQPLPPLSEENEPFPYVWVIIVVGVLALLFWFFRR